MTAPKKRKSPKSPTAKTTISEALPLPTSPVPTPTGTAMDTGIMPEAVLTLHGQNRVVQAIKDAIDVARAADREPAVYELTRVCDEESELLIEIKESLEREIRAHMRAICPWCACGTPFINTRNGASTVHGGGVVCEAAREALVLAGCVVVGVGETTKSKGGRSGVNDER